MEFLILGPLEVSDDGRKLVLGGPKQRAVLAHLILRANRVVAADLLIDGLWGDEPPESARTTLQTYVYRLRKVLGDGRLEGRDGGYMLAAAPGEIDAARFEALVKQGKAQVASDPSSAAAILSDALSLWRADALADVTEEPSLRGEAARLEELRLSATEHRVSAEIAMGGHSTVVPELESLTARYPLRERMWANLMLALYRSGRQAEALSTFERARQVLAGELGADPSPELQRLHERILHGDPALGTPAGGAPEPARPKVRPSRVDLQPGTEVAGYRIERTLGRGGMSVVYLAEHDWLQRKVALKVLSPQLAEDERFRERFVRESRLAASLDHPNVIPIYEAGASGGDLFIAMRYVEGTDLRTLLHESGAIEPASTLAIVRQVAAALDAAHEQGLVHRDVKPGNVLLARQRGSEAGEHVYLSDFGLTKRSASDSGITGTGQFVGTLDYAAPEQFKGGVPDARTDVYSLGCVLFECLTGSPPFTSENDAGLMYAHLQGEPPSVTARQPELPREIDRVVAMAMAKAPADRQQTAGALAADAARALGIGVPAAATDGRTPLRRLILALAVAAALVVGIVVSSLFQGDATPADDSGATSEPAASPSPTVPPTFRTVERALSDSEAQLLTYVPDDVSSECLPLDRDEPIHGERASLVCRTADIEVLYELFQTRDEMNEAFQVNVNNKAAPEGECATEHLAVGSYTIDSEPAGRVLCYTVKRGSFTDELPPQSHIEWTDENASIYAHAIRNDLGDLSLYEWWLTSSGPVLATGGAVPEKDTPSDVAGARLQDGVYLLAPRGGCAHFTDETCALHIEGTTYRIRFTRFEPPEPPSETGTLLLQKPNSVLFSPQTGYCFTNPLSSEQQRSPRPAAFRLSGTEEALTFEKTRGGNCAGPQKLYETHEAWTPAPQGLIALEEGGEIEFVSAGGAHVGSTAQTDTNPNSWPAWSPDGSRIVFAGAGQDGYDLYVMNADGTDLEQITREPGDETAPDWSPDGEKIVFAFDDGAEPDFRSGLATVSPNGSALTELFARTNLVAEVPSWSPDGSKIAFTIFTNAAPEPYVVDADGSDLVKLRDEPGVVLSWTPDGRRIILSGDGSLLSVRPDGSGERVFVEEPPETGRLVVDWSPDGDWMVMSTPTGLDIGNNLYLMRADGSQVFQIGLGREPAWRPRTP
ncbi:MAG TPA: BTAD domain-containing putative transcriptional regulator [Actinomycetota bacterium]|jgi:serine/threonine-protein kinase